MPAATNLITNGGAETNATGWVARNGSETVARSTAKSMFGSASVSVTLTAASVSEGVYHAFTGAASTQYSGGLSVWVPVGISVKIYGFDNVGSFVGGMTAVGNNDWQRLSVTWTTGAGAATFRLYARCETAAAAGVVYYVDGMQIEAGGYATPYIETNGGTAARTAVNWVV